MKKYTYNDWWNGKVHLAYCPATFKPEQKFVAGVEWTSIKEKDIPKIKKKQQKIFEKEKNIFLKRFKNNFSIRYKNSNLKQTYLGREILHCKTILNGNVRPENLDTFYELYHTGTILQGKVLFEYQKYFKNVIINGEEEKYDFIHSPNFLFQEVNEKPKEIFASALWKYYEWLNDFKEKRANQQGSQKTTKKNQVINSEKKIDLDLWNEKGKGLFEYLIENYNKAKGSQKYINIFHFLKNTDKLSERKEVGFHCSVDQYKTLIYKLTNDKIKWVKTNKPLNYSSQLIILNRHYTEWRKTEIPQNTL